MDCAYIFPAALEAVIYMSRLCIGDSTELLLFTA